MLASWVEKPPSDSVEKAWQMASNHGMPAAHSAHRARRGQAGVDEPQELRGLGDARRELAHP